MQTQQVPVLNSQGISQVPNNNNFKTFQDNQTTPLMPAEQSIAPPEHHFTSHRLHPTLPILPHIQTHEKVLRFNLDKKKDSMWSSVHPIYDAGGNVVYEVRGGGQTGAHTLVDTSGQTVATATGSSSRIMITVQTQRGIVSADYHRHLLTARKTLTLGGAKYSCGHDAIDGKRAHSWSLDHALEPLMTEEGSNMHNEWHMHFFPSCSEELEKALIMVTLYEHHVV